MSRFELTVTLTLVGPILTRSTAPQAPGVDAPFARDAAGRAILPYSLVQGKLREAWEEIGDAIGVSEVERARLLGAQSSEQADKAESYAPQRGLLHFGDFVGPTISAIPEGGSIITSLRRDPERGAAGDGLLRQLEPVGRAGEDVTFEGTVHFVAKDDDDGKAIAQRIKQGLRFVTQFGAERTSGYGRLKGVTTSLRFGAPLPAPPPHSVGGGSTASPGQGVASETDLLPSILRDATTTSPEFDEVGEQDLLPSHLVVARTTSTEFDEVGEQDLLPPRSVGEDRGGGLSPHHDGAKASATRWSLAIKFHDPFCFATRPDLNLFESSEIVSGAALKGTIARTLREALALSPSEKLEGHSDRPFAALRAAFEKIRFTHAFPACAKKDSPRPRVVPLSRVVVDKQFFDVALCERPGLIHGEAPKFAIDWKFPEWRKTRDAFGWPELKRDLRVRTAIDGERRRAEDEKLFAIESICPEGATWRAEVDLSKIKDAVARAKIHADLEALFAEDLHGFGKTGARARLSLSPAAEVSGTESGPEPLEDGSKQSVWVVTLATPALLVDPRVVRGADDVGLHAAFRGVWHEVSRGALALVRSFTELRLAGGYLAKRYRGQTASADKWYEPYLLVEAGSVFVLAAGESPGADAKPPAQCLKDWLAHGLPLPDWAKTRYGEDWQTNPFLPANGFGEIAVNLGGHATPAAYVPINAPINTPIDELISEVKS